MTSMTSFFSASTSRVAKASAYRKSAPIGLARGECWCRTLRSSWLGHQSWFVCGRPGFAVGASITGFSLSLPFAGTSLGFDWGWSDTVLPLLRGAGMCSALWCGEVGLRLGGPGARGTETPVRDLGLVQYETRCMYVEPRRVQARCRAGGAVDVDDVAAAAAHHVVVVVPHPQLVARHRAGRLDPPDQAKVGQGVQHVVH